MEIKSADDMITAAKCISETYHCALAVLCKGGHQLNDANDLLYRDGGYRWFNGKRIHNSNTHGTGHLSSAMHQSGEGYDLDTAVERAKAYISGALGAMLDLEKDPGRWIMDLISGEKDLRRNAYDNDREAFEATKEIWAGYNENRS